MINALKEYFLKPRFHISRFEFNLIGTLFLTIGLVVGTYLGLYNVFKGLRAFNDTIHVWEYSEENISEYIYDDSIVGINDEGLYAPSNRLENGGFEEGLGGWSKKGEYILNDEFTTDRVAGEVDGTSAEPTGGTRTVIDSEDFISIGEGVLNVAGGTGTEGDPGLWYPLAITRIPGRMIVGTINLSTLGNTRFGFDLNTSGGINFGINFGSSSSLALYDGLSSVNVGSALSTDTNYQLAVILRSTGTYYYIKGGTFVNWTLLWISDNASNSTVYPTIVGRTGIFTADNIRIPTQTWLPTPLVHDTFTRVNGNVGSSEIVGPDGQETPQLQWSSGEIEDNRMVIRPELGEEVIVNGDMSSSEGWSVGSDWSIADGIASKVAGTTNQNISQGVLTSGLWYQAVWTLERSAGSFWAMFGTTALTYSHTTSGTFTETARANGGTAGIRGQSVAEGSVDNVSYKPLTLSSLFSTVSTSDADVIADVNITVTAGTQAGLVLNLDNTSSPANFIIVYTNGTQIRVDEVVNGVYTNKQTTSSTFTSGNLRVIKDGTKYRVYYNNVLVGTEQTITDESIINNTNHGLFSTYEGNSFDNFTIWPRTGFTDAPFEELTPSIDTEIKYKGTNSVKLQTGGVDANYLQTTNLGDTEIYTLTGYAYTDGSEVSSEDISLYYDNDILETRYIDMGEGWYKLEGEVIGEDSEKSFGVRVKANRTVYIDEFSLYRKINRIDNGMFINGLEGWNEQSPSDIEDLLTWIDFSDKDTLFINTGGTTPVNVDGDLIYRVADKSDGNDYWYAISAGVRPVYKENQLNGLSAAHFPAGNYLRTINSYGTYNKSIFTVARLLIDENKRNLYNRVSYNFWTRDGAIHLGRDSYISVPAVSDTNYIITALWDTGSNARLRLNRGIEEATGIAEGWASNYMWHLMSTAAEEGGEGYIYESIIYDRILSIEEYTAVESYLNNKWFLNSSLSTTTKYTGPSSAQLQTSDSDATFVQYLNLANTDTYTLTAYAYTDGSPVTTDDINLYFDNDILPTTFLDAGNGWYKLTATLTATDSYKAFGVQVKANKTVNVDNFSLDRGERYVIYTSNAYTNETMTSWDTFCEGDLEYQTCTPDSTQEGYSEIRYQLCTDDGSVCESENKWQYWNGTEWVVATDLDIHNNSASDLTQQVMQTIDTENKKLSVKTILTFDGYNPPILPKVSIGLSADTIPPETNASNLIMKTQPGGRTITNEGWNNTLMPYITWTQGADNKGGSGLKGYCVYLGQDQTADPQTSKGILGESPVDLETSTCGFIVEDNILDLSNTDYHSEPWLTSSTEPYYLKVKAIDRGNNVYEGESETFTFYIDTTPPTNVSFLSCASGNFSNALDMNFSWPTTAGPEAKDDYSDILGWQYKLNDINAQWKGTQTHTGLEIEYIPLGQSIYTLKQSDAETIISGSNVVYFRSVDNVGNFSSGATIRTCSISYGGAAPNFEDTDKVTITPNISQDNQYSLSWPSATPAPETQVSKYYYMINTAPPSTLSTLEANPATYINNSTSTAVPLRALPNVNKGVNTVYVVSVDNSEIPNYSPSNYITGTFTLNSTDPDNVGDLVASDSSIKLKSQWNVTLTWVVPEYKGAGNLTYEIYRSTNGVDFTHVGSTSGLSYVDSAPQSRMYFYKVYTKDGANSLSSGSNAVSITPTGRWTTPPELISEPEVENVTTQRATIVWSTSRSADSRIQFGTQSGKYADVEPSTPNHVTSHVMSLSGLTPNTTYFYRAKWTDEDGNVGISEEKTFTTAPPPVIKQVEVRNIGLESAVVNFTSEGASGVKIYYGRTSSFGGIREISTSSLESTYSVELSDLEDGTRYYFKINTLDVDGSEYDNQVNEFQTLPRPRVSNVRLQQVSGTAQSTILVTWDSNTEISSIVTYWPENNPSQARDEVSVELKKGEHRMMIRGLEPTTAYNLQVKGRDKMGNEAVSDTQRFTTATDTRPPVITDLRVEGSTIPPFATTAQQTSVQIVVSWTTDEPATSQVEFGEGTGSTYAQRTQKDSNFSYNHTVVISNLVPSQVYHLRAVSEDMAGNVGYSIDVVTIAPKVTDNALDLVIQNLMETFRFLRR